RRDELPVLGDHADQELEQVFLPKGARAVDAPALPLDDGVLARRQRRERHDRLHEEDEAVLLERRAQAVGPAGLDLARDARIVLADVDLGLVAAALLGAFASQSRVLERVFARGGVLA